MFQAPDLLRCEEISCAHVWRFSFSVESRSELKIGSFQNLDLPILELLLSYLDFVPKSNIGPHLQQVLCEINFHRTWLQPQLKRSSLVTWCRRHHASLCILRLTDCLFLHWTHFSFSVLFFTLLHLYTVLIYYLIIWGHSRRMSSHLSLSEFITYVISGSFSASGWPISSLNLHSAALNSWMKEKNTYKIIAAILKQTNKQGSKQINREN